MEKSYVSMFLLLIVISCALAKDAGKKDSKDTTAKPKLPQTLSRGWGDQLIWTQTYEEALFRAKHSQKPLMIIHHLEDCPHSQALKKVFAEHKDIQKLAEKFILLNLVYETTDKNLAPDGQYVPRVLFIDPSLTVRADITGRYSNRLYAYEPSDISLSGLKALQVFQHMNGSYPGSLGMCSSQTQQLPEQLQKVLNIDAENSSTPEEMEFHIKFMTTLCFQFLLFPFKTSR
ncbi:hypothetical protein HGM15179_014659 [Zosterops borbonicus]|uniref:Anterior gradient protein 2 n=1 Tax=Zosterops borbonicus TaxID=364589 RepID=A0A8K1LFU9_9PASS|nr:hypothetical protein HGM15179_014659 [Zosterops borbonicus]